MLWHLSSELTKTKTNQHRLRSDDKEFDFQSLVFESPLFTFLHAQEFFISHDAACDQPIDVEPPPVPVDVEAKRAQLQQRFVVQHIKESLVSLSKRDVSSAKGMRQLFHRKVLRLQPLLTPNCGMRDPLCCWKEKYGWKMMEDLKMLIQTCQGEVNQISYVYTCRSVLHWVPLNTWFVSISGPPLASTLYCSTESLFVRNLTFGFLFLGFLQDVILKTALEQKKT